MAPLGRRAGYELGGGRRRCGPTPGWKGDTGSGANRSGRAEPGVAGDPFEVLPRDLEVTALPEGGLDGRQPGRDLRGLLGEDHQVLPVVPREDDPDPCVARDLLREVRGNEFRVRD